MPSPVPSSSAPVLARSSGNRFGLREFVYVLHKDRAVIRLGWTTSPSARISDVQTGASAPVHYAFVASLDGAGEAVEQAASAILEAHKLPGGWFAVSPELGIAALALAAHRMNRELRSHDPVECERAMPAWPVEPVAEPRRRRATRQTMIVAAVIGGLLVAAAAASLIATRGGAGF
jgi:hypothetical protein